MVMNESMSIIRPIPDENTSEAIMYGSQYMFAKSSKYFWDQTQDIMDREIRRLIESIRDPEFALFVVKHRPDMIHSTEPPVNEPDRIRDLWTLRQIVAWGTGEELLEVYRTENLMWAMMHGISEYSGKLLEHGITQQEWKAATLGFDLPIEYDTIRTIADHDMIRSKKEMDGILDEESRRKAEQDRFRREYAMFLNGQLDSPRDDSPADRIPIFREETIREDEPEDAPPEPADDDSPVRPTLGMSVARLVAEWDSDPLGWILTEGRESKSGNGSTVVERLWTRRFAHAR